MTLLEKTAPPLWEDVSQRGKNRKVYTRDGLWNEAVYFAGPVHISQADGSYKEIPKCIHLEEKENFFENNSGRFQVRFNRKGSDALFQVEKDGCRISASTLKREREKGCMQASWQQKEEREYLLYENAADHTDYRYSVTEDRVKEDIVIQSRADSYRYAFLLETGGLKLQFCEAERTLTFHSLETGEEVFMIPAPFMTDGAGERSEEVCYEVRRVNETQTVVTVIPDSAWIDADKRVFPVTIDPQIVLSGDTDADIPVERRQYDQRKRDNICWMCAGGKLLLCKPYVYQSGDAGYSQTGTRTKGHFGVAPAKAGGKRPASVLISCGRRNYHWHLYAG